MAKFVRYPDDYNPIIEYWDEIKSGKALVSKSIYQVYKHLAEKVESPDEYFYSPARANHFFEFAENMCKLSQGKDGYKLVKLELWEKAMLGAIFGFVDEDGIRQYKEACFIVGKKNGKSLIASLVGLYMLCGDGEIGPEVYSVSTKKDQSRKIWLPAKLMVLQSPLLRKIVKPLVSSLYSEFNFGEFKYLSSDADTLDGLNIHAVLMDELHQWKNGKALYNIMSDGMSAREQPLCLITTTAGTIREDIFDEKYDEYKRIIAGYEDGLYEDARRIGFIYELDKREEWTEEKCWYKANPGLGSIKSLIDLREKVRRAQKNSHLVKNLVCKEFNIRELSADKWLTFEKADNRDTFDIEEIRGSYGIGGNDLSATTDLTYACILVMKPGNDAIYVVGQGFMPGDTIKERSKEDKVPYDLWVERGFITPCSGNKVDYRDVTDWYIRMKNEQGIIAYWNGYDSWNSPSWVEDMENRMGYKNKDNLLPVIMGAKTLSAPMKIMGADLGSKRINYNNNPLIKWALTNLSIQTDRNENIRPVKGTSRLQRIDPAVAMLIAYTVLQNKLEDYKGLIGW